MSHVRPDAASTIKTEALATVLGVTAQKVRDYTRQGVIEQTTNQGEYRLIAAVSSVTKHLREAAAGRTQGDEMNAAKLSKMKADAAKAQMNAAAMQGTLILADKIEARWNAAARVVRASMLSMSSRLTQRLNLAPEAAEIVKQEITDALADLADSGADAAHADEVREQVANARNSN